MFLSYNRNMKTNRKPQALQVSPRFPFAGRAVSRARLGNFRLAVFGWWSTNRQNSGWFYSHSGRVSFHNIGGW
jgi:hypothetical protein